MPSDVENKSSEFKSHGGARPGAGRPRGAVNKVTRPVRELAAQQGPRSIEKLVFLRDHGASEQVQFAAAKELLDRAYGRARQDIDVNEGKRVTVVVNRDKAMENINSDTLRPTYLPHFSGDKP